MFQIQTIAYIFSENGQSIIRELFTIDKSKVCIYCKLIFGTFVEYIPYRLSCP